MFRSDSGHVPRLTALFVLLAGFASATGFAPLGLWPVTLAAFIVLIRAVQKATALKWALCAGWLFGVGHFTLGLNWIAHAFTFQDAMPHWFGYGAVLLLSLYLAVYPAMAAGLAWRWGRGSDWAYILFFAGGWIVTEWLRAKMFTGFAWNPLAATMVDTPLATWTRLIGTYGVSGLIVLFAGMIGIDLARHFSGGVLRRSAALTHSAMLVVAALLVFSVPALIDRTPAKSGGPLVRVVQPNIGQETKNDPAYDNENFRKHARLSGRPEAEPRLLLWPEAAVPEYLDEDGLARARLASLLGSSDLLLTGATKRHRAVEIKDGYYEERTIGGRNSLYAMDAKGNLLHRYDKAHLVPYGEYLPMRPILSAIGLSRLVPGDIDFWSGPGPASYALPGFGKVGIQICYEIIFSGQVVDGADRPDFLFNPSNDAWFGSWGPPQHLAQARLRAVEEGLPVIRSTPNGISAVVDADGNLLGSIGHHQAGYIEMRLPPPHAPTIFARFGNLLPLAFALLLTGLGVAIRRRAR